MNLFDKWASGLKHEEFLSTYGSPAHQQRWRRTFELASLTDPQKSLLRLFTRQMPVLVLAGAWCGDCSGQCPIFERFAEAAPVIQTRYLDRDVHADVQRALPINGGNRVPVVVFFSEDGHEVARYGERTLSQYRQLAAGLGGATCSTGIAAKSDPLLAGIQQDWLDEFERVQWILRLSPRLRAKHGD
jgi:thiol-disulfide isomerase/thioredoxin